MALGRLAQHFPGNPATKYARPARTATVAAADAPEAPVAACESEVEQWCDMYMARLHKSVIITRNAKNVPSARTSANDAAVLGALCYIMREAECGCFAATELQIAARASVAPGTAGSALRRLENAAYLVRHPAGRGAPTRYSLMIEKLEPLAPGDVRNLRDMTTLESLATGDLSHEVFAARAIGKTAPRTYLALLEHPDSTAAEIARATGRNRSTISRAMKKLRAVGMGEEDAGLWQADTRRVRTDEDLDQVAETTDKIRSKRRRENMLAKQEREEAKAREEAAFVGLYEAVASATTRSVLVVDPNDSMERSGPLLQN